MDRNDQDERPGQTPSSQAAHATHEEARVESAGPAETSTPTVDASQGAEMPSSAPLQTENAQPPGANTPGADRQTLPFHAFLDFILPLLPPPTAGAQPQAANSNPTGSPAPTAAGGPSSDPSLPSAPPPGGAQSEGASAPRGPRDGIIIFLNFGPSHPATSSNPAKAKEMLKSLPDVDACTLKRVDAVVRAESGEDDGWACGICLESEGDVKALPCNHLFHRDCLEPWFSTHLTCPTCRMQLDPLNTLSNHDAPASRGRTSTMRPAASGSNTPSARSTPYPARTPQTEVPPAPRDGLTTTIVFGGPFHSSPAPLGADLPPAAPQESAPAPIAGGAERAAAPEGQAPAASPMQTDTPPPGMPPFSFFFPMPDGNTPAAGPAEDGRQTQRFIFFGEPPPGQGAGPPGEPPHLHFHHPAMGPGTPPVAPAQDATAAFAEAPATGANAERPRPPQPFAQEPRFRIQPWMFPGTAPASQTLQGDAAAVPAATEPAADAEEPPLHLFGTEPRFRVFPGHTPAPPSEPAEPPRKTITLDQWLHTREKALGWRCDGPICGLAPSEDDLELAGPPAVKEETCAIYSLNQPYFVPPPKDAPPRAEDFTILACAHRWHRSCLEIAARSGGYWRVEDGRVWVRCMACRHEGWIHTAAETKGGEEPAAATTTCTT